MKTEETIVLLSRAKESRLIPSAVCCSVTGHVLPMASEKCPVTSGAAWNLHVAPAWHVCHPGFRSCLLAPLQDASLGACWSCRVCGQHPADGRFSSCCAQSREHAALGF